MSVPLAYLLVILIWSTTPLGIVWSSESISPSLALLLRMAIAVAIGLPLMKLLKIKLDWRPQAIKVYLYSSLSLAFGMLFCYLAGRHISSGLMSLSFGVAPFISGILAQRILDEKAFSIIKKLSLVMALAGLGIVSWDNLAVGQSSAIGFLFIFVGVFTFSLSGVLVKSVDVQLHAMSTTMGSLIVSMPMFLLFWLVMDGQLNVQDWQPRAVWSVIYLGVFASFIGFLAYFYVLQNLAASTVALIVMATPVLSTVLGIIFNDEHFSYGVFIGGGLVVVGLGLFQFGDKLFKKPANLTQITAEGDSKLEQG